jgi:hypothetical protein
MTEWLKPVKGRKEQEKKDIYRALNTRNDDWLSAGAPEKTKDLPPLRRSERQKQAPQEVYHANHMAASKDTYANQGAKTRTQLKPLPKEYMTLHSANESRIMPKEEVDRLNAEKAKKLRQQIIQARVDEKNKLAESVKLSAFDEMVGKATDTVISGGINAVKHVGTHVAKNLYSISQDGLSGLYQATLNKTGSLGFDAVGEMGRNIGSEELTYKDLRPEKRGENSKKRGENSKKLLPIMPTSSHSRLVELQQEREAREEHRRSTHEPDPLTPIQRKAERFVSSVENSPVGRKVFGRTPSQNQQYLWGVD